MIRARTALDCRVNHPQVLEARAVSQSLEFRRLVPGIPFWSTRRWIGTTSGSLSMTHAPMGCFLDKFRRHRRMSAAPDSIAAHLVGILRAEARLLRVCQH